LGWILHEPDYWPLPAHGKARFCDGRTKCGRKESGFASASASRASDHGFPFDICYCFSSSLA
jgi:hypothetical protein